MGTSRSARRLAADSTVVAGPAPGGRRAPGSIAAARRHGEEGRLPDHDAPGLPSATGARAIWWCRRWRSGVVAISFAAIFLKLAEPTHALTRSGLRLLLAAALLLPAVVRGWRQPAAAAGAGVGGAGRPALRRPLQRLDLVAGPHQRGGLGDPGDRHAAAAGGRRGAHRARSARGPPLGLACRWAPPGWRSWAAPTCRSPGGPWPATAWPCWAPPPWRATCCWPATWARASRCGRSWGWPAPWAARW